jgi:hypothetical protein
VFIRQLSDVTRRYNRVVYLKLVVKQTLVSRSQQKLKPDSLQPTNGKLNRLWWQAPVPDYFGRARLASSNLRELFGRTLLKFGNSSDALRHNLADSQLLYYVLLAKETRDNGIRAWVRNLSVNKPFVYQPADSAYRSFNSAGLIGWRNA